MTHARLSFALTAALALCACKPAGAELRRGPTTTQAFPAPARPVADIVSDSWATPQMRDAAGEVPQIVHLLGLKPGMRVADIGAGEGYDSLRLARVLGPKGQVVAQDVTAAYLDKLQAQARRQGLANIRTVVGKPDDPALGADTLDAAIMVHMYHEIAQPYAFLHRLAPALKAGGRVGVEELDRPTNRHGTPPALLRCEWEAVGYRQVSVSQLQGGLGYFAVFEAPTPDRLTQPSAIKPCR
jgi:predicted methyltransferase